jgi:hypothetical protein
MDERSLALLGIVFSFLAVVFWLIAAAFLVCGG